MQIEIKKVQSKGQTINNPGGGSGKIEKKTHRPSSEEKKSPVGCPENKKLINRLAMKKRVISRMARKKNNHRFYAGLGCYGHEHT